MYFLIATAVLEFCCAVYFYQQTRVLARTISDRDETIETLLNDADEVTAELVRRSEVMLSTILNNTEYLMSTFAELLAAQAATAAALEALKAKLATPAGLTTEEQAALDQAVANEAAMLAAATT